MRVRWEAIVGRVLTGLMRVVMFALFYWSLRSSWDANPMWAAGGAVVIALAIVPAWDE